MDISERVFGVDDKGAGEGAVAIPVQLKTVSRAMRPEMYVVAEGEGKRDSVREREVASVPPSWEPKIRRGLGVGSEEREEMGEDVKGREREGRYEVRSQV